jgi:hypothetical protein
MSNLATVTIYGTVGDADVIPHPTDRSSIVTQTAQLVSTLLPPCVFGFLSQACIFMLHFYVESQLVMGRHFGWF